MADLTPVAFDIETSGLEDDAVITVAGLAHKLGEFLILNTGERNADQEMLRRNGRRVLEEVEKTIIPSISLPRPEDTVYSDEELVLLEAIAAINNDAANQSGEKMSDLKNPDPDLDDPFYEDGPTGETLLEAVKNYSVGEIAEVMNFILKKTYLRVKPKLNELDNFDTNVMVALDITYVAYWGEEEGLEWLQGAPENKEYRKCHKFVTASIVGQHSHCTVAVLPLGSTEYADNDAYLGNQDQSYHIGDVTRQLLDIANEYVNIRTVFGDREFYATDAIAAIEEQNLRYIIPDDDDDGPQPFITNIERVSDEIAIDRRSTKRLIERYSNRAAIENTYSSIKECAAKTTSKAFEVRWFHFGFACIIYNLWLLVDFLTQERIGVIETRKKPRIKLSRFLRWIDFDSSFLI